MGQPDHDDGWMGTYAGLSFRRWDDGTVEIADGATPPWRLDANSWASVVAAMSPDGGTHDSFLAAKEFHQPSASTCSHCGYGLIECDRRELSCLGWVHTRDGWHLCSPAEGQLARAEPAS